MQRHLRWKGQVDARVATPGNVRSPGTTVVTQSQARPEADSGHLREQLEMKEGLLKSQAAEVESLASALEEAQARIRELEAEVCRVPVLMGQLHDVQSEL